MAWQPLQQVPLADRGAFDSLGTDPDDEAWVNDTYQVFVKYLTPPTEIPMPIPWTSPRDGFCQLSIKRHDREPARDWRHLQQIKNEILGEEREALELFPRESRLMDTSNQYHLWAFPKGVEIPIGVPFGHVSSHEQTKALNRARTQGHGKQKQRPWEPGLTTGRNEHTQYLPEEAHEAIMSTIKSGALDA